MNALCNHLQIEQIYLRSFWRRVLRVLTFGHVLGATVVKLNEPFVFDDKGLTAIIEVPAYSLFGTFDATTGSLLVEARDPKWKRKIQGYSIQAHRTVAKEQPA